MKTIAIISQKGGSGKTTMAVHLAVCAERHGQKTAILDLDPQGSALEWYSRREQETPEVAGAVPEHLEGLLAQARANGAHLVLIDTAPHSDRAAVIASGLADLILVPCRPSAFDISAIETTLKLLRLTPQALDRTVIVLNAAPTRGTAVCDEADAGLSAFASVAPVRLHHRAAYAHAVNSGHSVEEYDPRSKAAQEIRALYDFVISL